MLGVQEGVLILFIPLWYLFKTPRIYSFTDEYQSPFSFEL